MLQCVFKVYQVAAKNGVLNADCVLFEPNHKALTAAFGNGVILCIINLFANRLL